MRAAFPPFTSRQSAGLILAIALTSGSGAASANDQADGERHERRGPPPEAFEACAGAQENDQCDVVGRRGEQINGICRVPRRHRHQEAQTDAESLLCVPERRRESLR